MGSVRMSNNTRLELKPKPRGGGKENLLINQTPILASVLRLELYACPQMSLGRVGGQNISRNKLASKNLSILCLLYWIPDS